MVHNVLSICILQMMKKRKKRIQWLRKSEVTKEMNQPQEMLPSTDCTTTFIG